MQGQQQETCNPEAENNEQSLGNWLTEYVALVLWAMLFVSAFLISSSVNGSFNPAHWGGISSFIVTSIATMSLWGLISYLDGQGKIRFEETIKKSFDLDEYVRANKTALDSVLAHYGYVATVGLFMAVSIYTLKPLIKFIPPLGGSLLAILAIASLVVYALFLLRLARRFSSLKKVWLYMAILLSIAVIDAQAIQMIIKGVPSVEEARTKDAGVDVGNVSKNG